MTAAELSPCPVTGCIYDTIIALAVKRALVALAILAPIVAVVVVAEGS